MEEMKIKENPVEEIFGLIKKVKKSKKSSVELQHEIGQILSEKYAKGQLFIHPKLRKV